MLFRKFDFNDASVAKFQISPLVHNTTWAHYYDQYNYILYKIIEKGLTKQYPFNCRARPILFLLRHRLELCLKHNLAIQGMEVPTQHYFERLYKAFGDTKLIPKAFREAAAMLDFDLDGSAFRYFYDAAQNQPYFDFKNQIETTKIIEKYNSITNSDTFRIGNISPAFKYDSRKQKWDLTFHMGECRQLAHIRTQYDETIEFIIEGILTENWEIDSLYLPRCKVDSNKIVLR